MTKAPTRVYARLDADLAYNDKVGALTDREFRVWVLSITTSVLVQSDGVISRTTMRNIGATPKLTSSLIEKGMWDRDEDGTIHVHDYLERQRSRAEIAAFIERQRAAAHAKWHPNGNASGSPAGSPNGNA